MRCIIVGEKGWENEHLAQSCIALGVASPIEIFQTWEEASVQLQSGEMDLLFLDQACIPTHDIFSRWKRQFSEISLVLTRQMGFSPSYQRGDVFGQLELPVSKQQLTVLLTRVNQMILFRNLKKRVYIRTFGHFDFYVDDIVVVFPNSRSKELLAMMVDRRGGIVTTEEMMEIFWPEEPPSEQHKVICRKAASQLYKTLQLFGVEGILILGRNQRAIAVTAVECDYFQYLKGDSLALQEYHGEYMMEYSWAEETNGRLYHLTQSRNVEY